MQNDMRKMSYLPGGTMTYSAASSVYNRDSDYAFPAFKQIASPATQFIPPEVLLGNYSESVDRQNGIDSSPQSRKAPADDPIQTHLLLQTALGDSRGYEVLSFEELEALKKKAQSMKAKIAGLRRRLALETKVRDAAKSLTRLHSGPSSTTSSPRVMRRSTSSQRETRDKAQAEFGEAAAECDSLARELYGLEQQERDVQKRILQHTAAILQSTHLGFARIPNAPFLQGGRPDSPASLDGQDLRSLNGGQTLFDNSWLADVSTLDDLDFDSGVGKLSAKPSMSGIPVQHQELLAHLSSGLEDMNRRLTAVLAKTNAQKANQYREFPEMLNEAVNISFAQRLDHLNHSLDEVESEQTQLQARSDDNDRVSQLQVELQSSLQENSALQREYDKVEDMMTSQLDDINSELYALLSTSSPAIPKVPKEPGPMDSLEYIRERLINVASLVQQSSSAINQSRQMDAVLQGLWSFILGAEADLRQRKERERNLLSEKRSAGSQIDSEDEVSADEEDELGEKYTLQAFNAKIQRLVSQSLFMKEKQSSLHRKIKVHRERADRSIASAAGNEDLRSQLDQANALYATAQDGLRDLESRSVQLEQTHQEKDARIKELQTAISSHEQDRVSLADARQRLVDLEQERAVLADGQDKLRILEQEHATLSATRMKLEATLENERAAHDEQKSTSIRAIEQDHAEWHEQSQQKLLSVESELASRNKEATKAASELADLRGEVVRLKTDLTIAQAELDGAYGTRSQRAADTANLTNTEATQRLAEISVRNAELEAQIMEVQKGGGERETSLRKELADTLKEFEELTKASVEQEREREDLESAIDMYRDRIEGLEAQIAEDQVKWLGFVGAPVDGTTNAAVTPAPAVSGKAGQPPPQSMSVVVLKNEFKKMMREARMETSKQLRAEQDERRRLEGVIKSLRKSTSSAAIPSNPDFLAAA